MKMHNTLIHGRVIGWVNGWVMLLAIASFTSNVAIASSNFKTSKAGPAPALSPEITAEQFDKAMDEAKTRGQRSVAKVEKLDDTVLTDSFKNLRNRIIGGPSIVNGKEVTPGFSEVKTADDLATVLSYYDDDANYSKLTPDIQFAVAQMAPLLAFRAFFNRTIEWVEPTPVAHMASVAALRALGSGVMVYFPTAQWKAGIEFLTVPYDGMGSIIRSEDDMHAFLETALIPAIVKMKDRLDALNFGKKPVYFDTKIFYGTANFFSDRDRYVRIGEAERRASLANAFYALSGLESLNAYYLNGLFKAIDQISVDYGFHTASFDPSVSTAKERFKVLKQVNNSDDFLKLRAGGAAWMIAAYHSLNGAVVNNALSFQELKSHLNDTESYGDLMDPRSFIGGSRLIASGLNNLRYIVTGQGSSGKVQSAVVSTEGRLVTLQNFYSNPPKSLTDLMPTAFDEDQYSLSKEILYDGVKVPRRYRNFLSGSPKTWPVAEYQKVFPEVKSSDDVKNTARILSQSWGGWLLGIPLSALVL